MTTDTFEKPDWFTTTFQLQGSVALIVLPRILLFCGFAALISLAHALGYPIYLEKFGDLTTNVIFNLVLGLLIVFRTNTSYDRFWEGRKAWGALVVNSRNLAHEIQLGVKGDAASKQAAIQLLGAFAIARKREHGAGGYTIALSRAITTSQ